MYISAKILFKQLAQVRNYEIFCVVLSSVNNKTHLPYFVRFYKKKKIILEYRFSHF